ncbi:MAG: hypothetical protein FJW83_09370 [Actinobacteria bacterium]|nr:hypothetical protein [Actinomycetota bacterium]
MWFLASLGVAAEVLGILLPWSLGLTETVDPQFTRILFWFSGHPIVYFWLLPVYVSWYLMLPRMVGGSIWSDGLTRIVFLSFLVLLPSVSTTSSLTRVSPHPRRRSSGR